MSNRPGITLITVLAILLFTAPLALAKEDLASAYGFTSADNESYLPEDLIAFIRPGVELELLDFVIPADLQPEVTMKITDPAGLPLDKDGVYTPGVISQSINLSYIPAGGEAKATYTPYYDRGGVYTDQGDGVYMYKFATVLPEDYDADATTTLVIVTRRDLSEFELDLYWDNFVYNFVPSGAEMVTPPRDIVSADSCNRCHGPGGPGFHLSHGGYWEEPQVCTMCHQEGFERDGHNLDFPVVIHEVHSAAAEYPAPINDCEVCHTGGTPTEEFPLVANPSPAPTCNANGRTVTELSWGDAGPNELRLNTADGWKLTSRGGSGSGSFVTGEWLNDLNEFFLIETSTGEVIQSVTPGTTVFGCVNNPPGVMMGEAASEHTRWLNRSSREVCSSCHAHSDIDFENGVGHPQMTNDDTCGLCHRPDGREYGGSIRGAHTVDYKSMQLGGVLVQILDVSDTGPGQRPVVTFSLSNKWGPLPPSYLQRLRFSLSGPNDDFSFYAQNDAIGNLEGDGGNWKFRFTTPLPSDAIGSFSLGVEGRIGSWVMNPGTDDEFTMNDQMQNFIEPFAVTGDSVMPRRMVVDDAKCESCHSNLSLHGSNRHDAGGYCQTCHMPSASDAVVRPEGEGAPQSIDFRYMVHKIHRGAELENGYVVYGYRSSVHDYSHVEYPADLRNCDACHVDDSQALPLATNLEMVETQRDFFSPMGPETAACLSCHDSQAAASHALSNSSEVGEACAACHGDGKTYSVEKVHAR